MPCNILVPPWVSMLDSCTRGHRTDSYEIEVVKLWWWWYTYYLLFGKHLSRPVDSDITSKFRAVAMFVIVYLHYFIHNL
jgi:hypothetical protein